MLHHAPLYSPHLGVPVIGLCKLPSPKLNTPLDRGCLSRGAAASIVECVQHSLAVRHRGRQSSVNINVGLRKDDLMRKPVRYLGNKGLYYPLRIHCYGSGCLDEVLTHQSYPGDGAGQP